MAVIQYPQAKTLVTASAAAATSHSDFTLQPCDSFSLILSCTAAAGTSPTLDVALQTSPDGGTTYVTAARFTQLTAAGAETISLKPYLGVGDAATSLVSAATGGSAKANMVLAKDCRILYTIGGTSPALTFKVFVVYAGGQNNQGGI
jgi:hypothetical protein